MKEILNHLYNNNNLTESEAKSVLKKITKGTYNNSQIASFLTVFLMRPITVDELEGFRDAMLDLCIPVNLEDHNIMLLHQGSVLIDSTRNNLLREEVSRSKQNEAMRHLSRSLRFFYDERYRDALSEVNIAIAVNPNLAIAYGRRGSIYYKLGDSRRATLNWNVALQLDPKFIEIHDMLKAYDENLLKTLEISNSINEN